MTRHYTRKPLEERFWSKVQKTKTCWIWTASSRRDGYGCFAVVVVPGERARMREAHRVAYELLVGPIPNGLTLDHLCRNRICVNPAHLEPVTTRENNLRGTGWSAVNAAKTHCKQGHPFDATNTFVLPHGGRSCKECRRIWGKRADELRRKTDRRMEVQRASSAAYRRRQRELMNV